MAVKKTNIFDQSNDEKDEEDDDLEEAKKFSANVRTTATRMKSYSNRNVRIYRNTIKS